MKKLLIVVDYQKDFIDGALGFPKALAIRDYLVNLIQFYETQGDEIVFTKDIHQSDYLHTIEGEYLPVPHCIANTPGSDFDPRIKLFTERHRIFIKPTFGSGELFAFLQKKQYASITLVGVVSNICVFTNAILAKTAQPNTPIIVDSKGSASFDTGLEQKGYDILRNLHIQII